MSVNSFGPVWAFNQLQKLNIRLDTIYRRMWKFDLKKVEKEFLTCQVLLEAIQQRMDENNIQLSHYHVTELSSIHELVQSIGKRIDDRRTPVSTQFRIAACNIFNIIAALMGWPVRVSPPTMPILPANVRNELDDMSNQMFDDMLGGKGAEVE